jgi:outer membrane protein OmpA-like peptidoglycan-associated protein
MVYAYPLNLEAKKKNNNKPIEVDIFELSIDENLAIPKLGKQTSKIIDFQSLQVSKLNSLKEQGYPYDVQTVRNGEVIMITIPMQSLFSANSTKLCDSGKDILKPLMKYCVSNKIYKMVLVAHTDNTGNDLYATNITTKRVNEVVAWAEKECNANTELVVPYALGNSDPIVDNNSISNRAKNRRLVIYLIPEIAMINQAKRNKITL